MLSLGAASSIKIVLQTACRNARPRHPTRAADSSETWTSSSVPKGDVYADRCHCRNCCSLTVLGLALALLAGPGQAADDKAPQATQRIASCHHNLRDVINHGADLYNSGDWAGCYRLYEGALMAVRPLLDHRHSPAGSYHKASPTPSATPPAPPRLRPPPSSTRSATR